MEWAGTAKKHLLLILFFLTLFLPISTTKNIGTKIVEIKVDPSIPPIIPVPTECSAFEFAPLAKAKGNVPRIKARDVIIIGRKRCRAEIRAASTVEVPSRQCSRANSAIKIAFLADNPNKVIKLI